MRYVSIVAVTSFLLPSLLFAQQAGSEAAPEDLPVELLLLSKGQTRSSLSNRQALRFEEYDLNIVNHSESAIVMIVFKKQCKRPGRPLGDGRQRSSCGESLRYFVDPVEAGETRVLSLKYSSDLGADYVVRSHSVLFEDGTSLGTREPYATQYLNNFLPTLQYYESMSVLSRRQMDAEEKVKLTRLRKIVEAVAEASRHADDRPQEGRRER